MLGTKGKTAIVPKQQHERQDHADRRRLERRLRFRVCRRLSCSWPSVAVSTVGQDSFRGALGPPPDDQSGGVGYDQHTDGGQRECVGLPG